MPRSIRLAALLLAIGLHPILAQSLSSPWTGQDIGAVGMPGSASGTGTAFTVRGAGADIWGRADAFHFVHRPLTGDGAIVARVTSIGATHPWAKAGVMMRDTLAPDARHAMLVVTPARGVAFQRRLQTGGESRSTAREGAAPSWVRLARSGGVITAQVSADGLAWRTVGTERVVMGQTIYVGLAVTSHDAAVATTAQFEGVAAMAGHASGVTLSRQPFLQQVTASSAVVVWTTFEATAGEVRYRGPDGTTRTAPGAMTFHPSSHTGLAWDFYQHEARLGALAAGTTYDYEVRIGGIRAFDGADRLRTAPAPGTGTVRFIAFGDSGTGSMEQWRLNDHMEAESVDLALHTGDLAYGNPRGTGDASFQSMHEWFFLVYERWLRRAPMFPSLGNHDSRSGTGHGVPYLASFVLPEDGASARYPDHAERFYSFDYGPVRFIALDTELAVQDPARRAEQLAWLDATLASTAQPWRIAYFHRTPYTAGLHHGSDLEVRAAFAPLFERHGVQLVLAAHEHLYERTWPQPPDRPAHERVVYVTTGGGGAPVYPAGSASWTAATASVHHYVRGQVDACTLRLEAVGLDGHLFDATVLDRCEGTGGSSGGATLPAGWTARDIGTVGLTGSAGEQGGTFTVRGEGADIWGQADGFHSVSRTLQGDGRITARVGSLQAGHHWAKAGVMMRESTAAGSRHAMMLVSRQRGLAFQRRVATNGVSTHTDGGSGAAPAWVRLVRQGHTFIAARSSDGVSWSEVGRETIPIDGPMQVGLAVTSHNPGELGTATFDHVLVEEEASGGATWASRDIGAVGRAGASSIAGGVFTVDGAGADIWGTADGFHFVSRSLTGDGEIVARVSHLAASHHWAKAGVMVREALTPGSRHAFMLVSAARGLAFQRRQAAGGASVHTDAGAGTVPAWVRLVRTGSTIDAYRSSDGVHWTFVGRETFVLPGTVYVGLAVTSHDDRVLARAVFDQVHVAGAP